MRCVGSEGDAITRLVVNTRLSATLVCSSNHADTLSLNLSADLTCDRVTICRIIFLNDSSHTWRIAQGATYATGCTALVTLCLARYLYLFAAASSYRLNRSSQRQVRAKGEPSSGPAVTSPCGLPCAQSCWFGHWGIALVICRIPFWLCDGGGLSSLQKHRATFATCWSFWQALGLRSLDPFPSYHSSHITFLPMRSLTTFYMVIPVSRHFSPTSEGQDQSAHKSLASRKFFDIFDLFWTTLQFYFYMLQPDFISDVANGEPWSRTPHCSRLWRSCSFKASPIHSGLFSFIYWRLWVSSFLFIIMILNIHAMSIDT